MTEVKVRNLWNVDGVSLLFESVSEILTFSLARNTDY